MGARLGGELGGERRGRAAFERLGLDAGPGPVRGDGEVRRQGQLLQADQPGALAGRQAHALGQGGPVLVRDRVPAVLDRPDPEQAGRSRSHPGVGDARGATRSFTVAAGARGTCWVMQCGPPPP